MLVKILSYLAGKSRALRFT